MLSKSSYLRSASFAAISTLPVILGSALFGATGASAATCSADPTGCDPYVVTIDEVGNTVVATGSGEFDLNGLMRGTPSSANFPAQIGPSFGLLVMASFGTLTGARDNYRAAAGTAAPAFPGQPSNFGTAPASFTVGASGMTTGGAGCTSGANCINSSGPPVAFGQNSNPAFGLSVPAGYMSGDMLSPTTVIFGPTVLLPTLPARDFANLGLTPGETTFSWGSEPDQSFSIDVVPLPATFPLLGTGLGALGLLSWRRKRRTQTVA